MFLSAVLYIGIPALLASITYFFLRIKSSGFFDKVEVSVVEKPPTISQSSVTVFYKHHIGSYANVTKILNEALDILPSGPKKTFGIFYDNPDTVSPERCQSAIGCIFSADGKDLYEANYASQLTRWGFERMVIPAVQRAVHTRQRFSGIFSIWHLTRHVYPKINEFIKSERLETRFAMEIYEHGDGTSGGHVDVILPLDHIDEFLVPEYLTPEKLEERLARKLARFDSDDSESESDPSGAEEGNASESEGDASANENPEQAA
ncbi:TAT-4.2 protein [Aphelenchoides avenae]|nr:TAT-4.2 protein [Aphelenchus avenae]